MGRLQQWLGLAQKTSPVVRPSESAVAQAPAHALDYVCAKWGCQYQRSRERKADGTLGKVQITLTKGTESVAGVGHTTADAIEAAYHRGAMLWGALE